MQRNGHYPLEPVKKRDKYKLNYIKLGDFLVKKVGEINSLFQ